MSNKDVKITLKMLNKMGPVIRQAESQMADFRNRVGADFKKWSMALGVVIAGALTASVAAGAQFEQSLANVGAVSRATAGEMAALEEKARSLGGSTAFSAGEAAEAMYSLSSGGLNVKETIAASEPVLKLAGATMSGMGEAAEITMASMAQFGLKATDSERIVNVFAAGIQNSTLNMQRLSDSMVYAGPVAASVGMTLEETTSALGLLHNAGLKGSIAGTGLAMSLQKILAPSEDLKKVLGAVSLEGDGFEAVIRKIEEANLSAGEMTKLFGPRAFKAIKALTTAGADGFAEMTDKLTGTNAVFEMYDRQMATTTSKFKIMKSAIQENLIAVFFKIKPVLDESMDAFTQFVQDVKPVVEELGVRLVAVFHTIWEKAHVLFAFFKEHFQTIKTLALVLGGAVIVFYSLATAISVMNAAIAISPIGWIAIAITAVVAIVALVINHFGGWTKAWIKLKANAGISFEFMRNEFDKLISKLTSVKGYFSAIVGAIDIVFSSIWDSIKEFVSKAGDALSGLGRIIANPFKAKETWAGVKAGLEGGLLGSFEGIDKKIANLWDDVGKAQVAEIKQMDIDSTIAIGQMVLNRDAALAAVDAEKALRDAEDGESLLDLYGTGGSGSNPAPSIVPNATIPADFQFIQEQVPEDQGFMGPSTPSPEQLQESLDALQQVGDAGSKAMGIVHDSASQAMNGVTNAITDAVFNGKNLLESLGGVGKSVFSSIMGGFLKMGITAGLGAIGVPLPTFASGGSYTGGQLSIIGEEGPELFLSGNSGTIIPNSGLKSMLGAPAPKQDGGVTIHSHVNITPGSLLVADNDRSIMSISEKVGRNIEKKINKTYRGRKS